MKLQTAAAKLGITEVQIVERLKVANIEFDPNNIKQHQLALISTETAEELIESTKQPALPSAPKPEIEISGEMVKVQEGAIAAQEKSQEILQQQAQEQSATIDLEAAIQQLEDQALVEQGVYQAQREEQLINIGRTNYKNTQQLARLKALQESQQQRISESSEQKLLESIKKIPGVNMDFFTGTPMQKKLEEYQTWNQEMEQIQEVLQELQVIQELQNS